MNLLRLLASTALLMTAACADYSPRAYADAYAVWDKIKGRSENQGYVNEFVQFNNQSSLDEKDGCYSLAPGPVDLILFIVHQDGDDFAVVQSALTDVDNEKARCFRKSYGGLRTKVPPYSPFVLRLTMG